jgi:hypothetical protein
MEKLEHLKLMDKILRELDDLLSSQTSVLKKVSQIEAHNITLGVQSLQDKLPDLHEQINSSVDIITNMAEAFSVEREKFFVDNKMAAALDPTE